MLTGGCQCGAVRYECDAAPRTLYVCHCLECRHQSGSAFGMSLEMPPGTGVNAPAFFITSFGLTSPTSVLRSDRLRPSPRQARRQM